MWLLQRCHGAAHGKRALAALIRQHHVMAAAIRTRGVSISVLDSTHLGYHGWMPGSGINNAIGSCRSFSGKKKDKQEKEAGERDNNQENREQMGPFENILQTPPNVIVQFISGNKGARKKIGRNATGGKIRKMPIPIKENLECDSNDKEALVDTNRDRTGDDPTDLDCDSDTSKDNSLSGNNSGDSSITTGKLDNAPGNETAGSDSVTNDSGILASDFEGETVILETDDDKTDNKLVGSDDDGIAPAHIKLPILHFHTTARIHALPALAMFQKPAFPGFYQVLQIQNQAVLQCLSNIKQNSGNDYVGGFLTKDGHARELQTTGLPVIRDDAGAVQSYDEMHAYGTLLQIITITPHVSHQGGQVILMPYRRIKMTGIHAEPSETYPLYRVSIEYVQDDVKNFDDSRVTKALHLEIIATVKELIKTSNFYKEHFDHIIRIYNLDNPSRIADLIAGISMAKREQLQAILAEVNLDKRLAMVLEVAKNDLEFAKVQAEVKTQIEEKMSREQRKYILNEQMKMIRKELGLDTDDKNTLIDQFEADFQKLQPFMPKEAIETFRSGLTRLKQLETSSAEYGVCRSHLEWLLGMPWGKYTKDSRDILQAQQVLDRHHFGLKDVKLRLMEYMATSILKGKASGKIICLAGPPGVGKTSIASAVAELLNRKLYRFSLGGLFDVAELRGHRRTYVGALPGKFVQALKYTGSMNPLILLDEIDKLGRDARGDPASALLEVLDPSQNEFFRDYYLDIPVDLSHVLFICTANAVDAIPAPLIDRMEIINIPGYLPEEKLQIAKEYLIPQTLKSTGLSPDVVQLPDSTIEAIVEHYSREAGVRTLLRCIEKIYRKVALNVVKENADRIVASSVVGEATSMAVRDSPAQTGELQPVVTDSESNQQEIFSVLSGIQTVVIEKDKLQTYLGVPMYTRDTMHPYPLPYGVVMGLAWTNAGGATMYVEARGQMVDKRGNLVEPNRSGVSLSEKQKQGPLGQYINDGEHALKKEDDTVENTFGTFHGTLKVTGHLGNVMTESSQIALTFCKTFIRKHQPKNLFLDEAHIHIHVPEGATPKDGPSGGITMASALISVAAKKRIKPHLAMTGELTLSGKVLRVGGIKEKLIAAIREGVTTVVLPKTNEPDVAELEESITQKLDIIYVDTYDDVYEAVFEHE